jgi:hypothetical protein
MHKLKFKTTMKKLFITTAIAAYLVQTYLLLGAPKKSDDGNANASYTAVANFNNDF